MFYKLKPEEYIKTNNILSESENPKTPWYNGMVLAKADYHPVRTTIIAYTTEPEDDEEIPKYEEELNKSTPYLPSPMPGMTITP